MIRRRTLNMKVKLTVDTDFDLTDDELVDLVRSNLQVGLFQDGDEMPVTNLTVSQVKTDKPRRH
jgi:hypothetical protein